MTDDTISTESANGHLDAGTVAAYIDNRLPPARVASVESHLAECAMCRREIVELGHIVHPGVTRRRMYIAGSALAAAAAVVLLILPTGNGSDAPTANSAAIRALGIVTQPPVYLGVPVRSTTERGTERFLAGMRAYTDAKYAEAVAALRDARAAGIEGAATPFFLGAGLLMLNDAAAASDEFAAVIGMGETSYLPEAHFYRAKSLLRLNRSSEAVADLESSVRAAQEPLQTLARSLLDSVRAARSR